ncbi:MAG: VCBS repeat-containing protein [Halobacteriota archaeon]
MVPPVMSELGIEDENTYFRFTGNVTQLWNESHEGANWAYACPVGDFDGDEKDDVLVFTRKYDDTTGIETATVIAKRGYDGEHLWAESVSGTESSISADPVGDLDGDGKEDVLVLMSEYNATTNTTIEKVVAKNGDDGIHLWEESVSCEVRNDCEMDVFPAGDLDGDGKEDVFVEMSTSGFDEDISASTTTATVIAKRGYDGSHLWNESVNGTGWGIYICASPAGDLDGDGKEDVLVIAANTTTATVIAKRGYEGMHLWEESEYRTGGVIPFIPSTYISASPAGDFDGDGKGDVLVIAANTTIETVIAKRGYDGTHLWEESVTRTGGVHIFASPAGDLDGDGKEDVLVDAREYDEATNSTTETVIAKKGENGAHLWEDSVNGTRSSYMFAKSAGDLDGDGKDDVLVRAREYDEATNTTTRTVIAKRGYDGMDLWNESVSCEDWRNCGVGAYPAGDLDGDGKEDVLVLAGEYDEATNTTTETVIVKRGYDGMDLWEEPVIMAEPFIPVDSVGDLDGDGKCDVLVHTSEYDEATDTRTEAVIAKRGYDGTHLWTAESDGPIWVVGTSWLVLEAENPLFELPWRRGPTDLTGDGIVNILLGTHDRVYAV